MTRLRALLLPCVAAFLLASAGLACGAPLLAAEPVDAASERAAGPMASDGTRDAVPERMTAPDVPNQSKTIQMLLEMQGKDPGLAGGERPRQEAPTTSSRRAAGDNKAQAVQPFATADAANPFGGATIQTQKAARPPAGDAAVDWTQLQPPRFGGGGVLSSGGAGPQDIQGSRGVSTRVSDQDEARWLIPRSVVRFVRQHRDLIVAGSVLLLLLIWGAAAMSAGRRNK